MSSDIKVCVFKSGSSFFSPSVLLRPLCYYLSSQTQKRNIDSEGNGSRSLLTYFLFVLFLLLIFLAVDLLLLPLVLVLVPTLLFVFDFDLIIFLLLGATSLLVVLIGPGGVEGSVDSVDMV